MLEKATGKFRPEKGFQGTAEQGVEPRTAPVQFEKESDDPFGLEKFLTAAKEGRILGHVGKSGFMSAAAGGSGSVENYAQESSKKSVQFEEASKRQKR